MGCILSTKRPVDDTDESLCRAAVEIQTEKRIVDTVGEERVGQTERVAVEIHNHI